jgi:hypothetical protein
MGKKKIIKDAVRAGRLDEVEQLISEDKKALRYLLGMTFDSDEKIVVSAATAIARAARYHPEMVKKIVLRLIWAMDGNSGTNAIAAPEVLKAIAKEQPELLIPMVPELANLAARDSGLHKGIYDTLRIVSSSCPGKVGKKLSMALKARMGQGGCCS